MKTLAAVALTALCFVAHAQNSPKDVKVATAEATGKSQVPLGGDKGIGGLQAPNPLSIELMAPRMDRGRSVMEALALRASTYVWSAKDLSIQDLSDLLWAANGVNRPKDKGRTAPSAVDAQDIDLYLIARQGVFRYDAFQHRLEPVASGDQRAAVDEMKPGSEPSALLVLVSDLSRFRVGTADEKREWATLDAGIVSQNISLFCAATGLGTRPRTDMDKALLQKLLKPRETQLILLNQAVGYPSKAR